MTDIARIGFRVETEQLRVAAQKLDELAQAGDRAEAAKGRVERASSRLRLGLAAAGAAITAAAGGLAAMVASAGSAADAAAKLSQRIGVSVESLTGLQFAAAQSGVSAAQLEAGLAGLTRQMIQARDGTGAAGEAFARLGVSVTDAQGRLRDGDAVLRDLAGALARLPDGAEKTALAMQTLGRSGQQLVPMLNQGAEGLDAMRTQAEALGVVMTDVGARAGERYADAMGVVTAAVRGLRTQLWEQLGPSVVLVVERMADWITQSGIVARAAQTVADVVRGLVLVLQGMAETARLAGASAAALADVLVSSLGAAVRAVRAQATAITEALAGLATLDAQRVRAAFAGAGDGIASAFRQAGESVSRNLAMMREEVEISRQRLAELDAALSGGTREVIAHEAAATRASRAVADLAVSVVDMERATERAARSTREATQQVRDLAAEARQAALRDLAAITDRVAVAMGGPAFRAAIEYRDALAALADIEAVLLATGGASAEQLEQLAALRSAMAEQYRRDMADMLEVAETTAEEVRRSWGGAIDWMSSALADWVTGGIRSTRDLGRAMVDIMRRTLADIVAMFLRQRITLALGLSGPGAALASTGGAGGGLLGGLLGAGGGGWMGALGGALAAAVPVALGVAAVNALTGGRLLGTRSQVTGGAQGFAVGPAGGSASAEEMRERRRSLFRGTRRWVDEVDPGDEARRAADELYQRAAAALAAAAGAVGAEVPEMISASFRRELDAQGRVVAEVGTIAGRQYRESAEAFARRVVAESILAGIDAGFAGASALAERWRGDADDLLDAAQALLSAASDIRAGRGLLESLADVVELLSELQAPGESLGDTYARLVRATAIYDDALGLLGVRLDAAREDVVRLAAAIADEVGGLDTAAGLWQRFFARFFDAAELVERRLEAARPVAAALLDAIGLAADIAAPDFRAAFEAALSAGLSAEATAAWLRAADALGLVLDLEDELARLRGAAADELPGLDAAADAVAAIMDRIADDLARLELTPLAFGLRQVAQQASATIAELQRLGASEQQLAQARRLAQAQMLAMVDELEQRATALAARLYGTPLSRIEDQIRALESQQVRSIQTVGQAAASMYQAQARAVEQIGRYLDALLLGPMSLLTPAQRMAEAERQYRETLDAARRGDADALGRLTGAADALLREARSMYASSAPTQEIFARIQRDLRSVGAGASVPVATTSDVVAAVQSVPAELAALLAERDRLLAEQSERERLMLATQLAATLGELSAVLGVGIETVADRIGVELADLAADLGIDPEDLAGVIERMDATQQARAQVEALASLGVTADAQLVELVALRSASDAMAEWQRAGVEAQRALAVVVADEQRMTRQSLGERLERVERAIETGAASAERSAEQIIAALREAIRETRA